jgi:molecular chaperone DnaJ
MKRDYYAVLGVTTNATSVQIRRAYQRLARQYSPDVNLWEQNARILFEEIAEAYRVLMDPAARTLYDRQSVSSSPTPGAPAEPVRQGGRRGDDLHVPVELSFGQAVTGVEADLSIDRLSPCASCGTAGTARGAVPSPCGHCEGSGVVWRGHGTLEAGPCPVCGGAGVRVSDPCAACHGRGVAPSRSVVRMVLPPGVDTGAQIRMVGVGHSGPFGGPRGDVILVVRVHDDPVFARKGDHIYCEVPVTIVEAVLGARISVRGPEGAVTVVIPQGTPGGHVFRLRGKGMPRISGPGRGDLCVTVKVEIPRGLDTRTQDLVRELGRVLPPASRDGVD